MGVLDRLLNQDSFTEAFDRLQENHKKLVSEYETQKAVNKELAEDYIRLEQKLSVLELDPEQYIEAEIEKRTLDLEAEYAEKMNHKWYGIGRQDAYREMGVRALDAKKDGNSLVILEDGSIVELLSGLEDVQIECKFYGGACAYPQGECDDCPRHEAEREWANTLDEIEIEDLASIGV